MNETVYTQENSSLETGGLKNQYKNWFLEYASYVILERAVPAMEDGLKPVQRRILHAMKEMDDGRYNKVANIIGQSMQYHPHGDASIGDALVNMGQKNLLIDTQGNWGDVRTGDAAAATRYIEARLSPFALEVLYNPRTTQWQQSYDGRKKEPITLPVKFPLLLAQGAEGIAVGLSTKILPHNFSELLEASIHYLKGQPFEIFPDFLTGGWIDVTQYNQGQRGGKIRVRAVIEEVDKKTIAIKTVPFGITVSSLCDSIVKANEQGKIKIKKLTDCTSKEVEILIDLAPNTSAGITIDALYAFTDCEIAISPNACVIEGNKPRFTNVSQLLIASIENTRALLQQELQIKLNDLNDKWHFISLEKIFFEEKIYKQLEQAHLNWEAVLIAIEKAFKPFLPTLKKAISAADIQKLTEKPVRRIYKLDISELREQLLVIEKDLATTQHQIDHLTDYTISYYKNLLTKYGKPRQRTTVIKPFETIERKAVAIANTKLYMNRAEGFVGTSLKKDEWITDCSSLDELLYITKAGIMKIIKVADKTFVGKDVVHIALFKKNDDRTIYNLIYVDTATGISYAKRFNVVGIIRDKEYLIGKSTSTKIMYLSVNPNGEAEQVKITLSSNSAARIKEFTFNFSELEIKGRNSIGNQVSKYLLKNVKLLSAGSSTLHAQQFWLDTKYGRLTTEASSLSLGEFDGQCLLLVIYHTGCYEIIEPVANYKLETEKIALIEKFDAEKIVTIIYNDFDKKMFFVKRFKIQTTTLHTRFDLVRSLKDNTIALATTAEQPTIEVIDEKNKTQFSIQAQQAIEVLGWKAIGTKLIADSRSVRFLLK